MMQVLKRIIKKITPKFFIRLYHLFFAYGAAIWYRFPSRRMVVIGVLGTRGKTTVSNLIWSCLSVVGYKVGLTGTANIRIGDVERVNPYHMTMPGRFTMQKLLAEMHDAGCQFAIVETPSEGVEQFRHIGIAYDIAIMTTLYPEYLEAHQWSYERCKEMHKKVFSELFHQPRKTLGDFKIPKTIIVNHEIEERDMFLRCRADKKITYSTKEKSADIFAYAIQEDSFSRAHFSVGPVRYELGIKGLFNVSNALAAIACASVLKIPQEAIQQGLKQLSLVPGRMEEIKNDKNISIFVDYAHDAVSLETALTSLATMKKTTNGNIILITGGQGGGRDRKKLPIMGSIAARYADYVIVANEDPYYDDPERIIEEIAKSCESSGKIREKNLFTELDRRAAIHRALSLAHPGDIVFIAGKGSEQSMETASGKIPWDDREVVREELRALSHDKK